MDILHTCDGVISGSTALHILLPKTGTPWMLADLDLYVPKNHSELMLSCLTAEGYAAVPEGEDDQMTYTSTDEGHIVHLTKGKCRIDVVISETVCMLSPIFHFHSTAVMNFVSTDMIFWTYPRLTL
ncbi:hypothetical protein EDC04DRAFT_2574486 [Pisolithus marmoratus]|nr:hypothetical protein EDC04DRAFT_2574486 [Pisolithus marmoratus]